MTITCLTADERRQLTGPALRGFFGIADAWALTSDEQMKLLGLSSRSTLRRWQRGEVRCLRPEALERVSYVFGIFRAINALLPQPKRANAWLRAPNTASLFGGGSALERMTVGNVGDLRAVRQYLDTEIAGC